MKTLISYIRDFIRADYSSGTYLAVVFFLTVSIILNICFKIETVLINEQLPEYLIFPAYFILYAIAYFGTLGIYSLTGKTNYFRTRNALIKPLIAIILISFDRTFHISSLLLQSVTYLSEEDAGFLSKIINQLFPSLIYIVGIYFIWKKYDRELESFYGFSLKGFDYKPYFCMFLVMLPLLFLASFDPDFTHQYPFFKYWNYQEALGLSPKQQFILYELLYLGNFINIELIFRGFLIIGMVQYMGKEAILPMVVTYAFIHFGKPHAETISSILGGYVLGIFAYRTRNISGGILIHIGIALFMDLFALMQLKLQ